jgi:hypothetical protein
MIETLITLAYLGAFQLQEELEVRETKKANAAKLVCDNVVNVMYFEYSELLNQPNNKIYEMANKIKFCLSLATKNEADINAKYLKLIMLGNLICSCVRLTQEQIRGLGKLNNRQEVFENNQRFLYRFRGQGVAMQKLEDWAIKRVKNRTEEQIKEMVISFINHINKNL